MGQSAGSQAGKLPRHLKLFCIYLFVMLAVVLIIQAVFALFVDDWSFGLKDPHIIALLRWTGVTIILAQHAYRVFTIVLLLRKSRRAASNAKTYLAASFAVVVFFALSSIVYFPPGAAGIAFQNVGQAVIVIGIALALMLPWWLVLRRN